VNDDVGLLADLQRADPISNADGLGTGDGGHLECRWAPNRCGSVGRAGDSRRERSDADVGDIVSVGSVATKRTSTARRSRHGGRLG
jgi:hypothetical protein